MENEANQKLPTREKVALYVLLFVARLFLSGKSMDETTQQIFDRIWHEMKCSL